MLTAVIDTNVIISAVLSPYGNPAKIINMVFDDKLPIFYSSKILDEYINVLSRPRLNIDIEKQIDFVKAIKTVGILIEPTPSNISMPDESDRIFYDVAVVARAILITGNIKHYPNESFIMIPTDFVKMIVETG